MRQHHSPRKNPLSMLALRRNPWAEPKRDTGITLLIFYNHQNNQKYEKNLLPAELPA